MESAEKGILWIVRLIGRLDLRTVWYPFYILLATGLIYLAYYNWSYDDPFITYRYANNLAHGLGFVYNPGEPILSTTTPLFTIFLAILYPLWSDLPHLANLIGAGCLALGGVCLWDLARTWKTLAVGWVGLLVFPSFPLLLATLGSEVPIYLAFCLGAFVFYARKRYYLAAAFAALASLTRPDGLLIPLVLGVDYLIQPARTRQWKAILIYLGLTVPWFIFAWSYFGSPIPATLAAKQHQGSMAISPLFAPRLPIIIKTYTIGGLFWLELALALIGIAFLIWRLHRWIPLIAWGVLYFVAYTILGVSGYYWYYAPLVPGWVVAIGLGVTAITSLLIFVSRAFKIQFARTDSFSTIFSVLFVLLLFLAQVNGLRQSGKKIDSRFLIYRAAGEWLKANTPERGTIGALEVGILGYYGQRPMIDFAGLLQPDVSKRLTNKTTYLDAAQWAAIHYKPDYLVLNRDNGLGLDPGYTDQYCKLAQHFPGELYDYQGSLDIYSCVNQRP